MLGKREALKLRFVKVAIKKIQHDPKKKKYIIQFTLGMLSGAVGNGYVIYEVRKCLSTSTRFFFNNSMNLVCYVLLTNPYITSLFLSLATTLFNCTSAASSLILSFQQPLTRHSANDFNWDRIFITQKWGIQISGKIWSKERRQIKFPYFSLK